MDGPPPRAHVAANNLATTEAPFAVFDDTTAPFIYGINRFGETAVNLTQLMELGLCDSIATLFIRTKASASTTAQL